MHEGLWACSLMMSRYLEDFLNQKYFFRKKKVKITTPTKVFDSSRKLELMMRNNVMISLNKSSQLIKNLKGKTVFIVLLQL